MRLRVSLLLVALSLFGMSAPAWAGTLSTQIDLIHAAKLANLNLKPGKYRLTANESNGQVKVEHHYRLIGRVKGNWVKLHNKPQYTEMLMTNHKIQEIRFAGKIKAVKFSA